MAFHPQNHEAGYVLFLVMIIVVLITISSSIIINSSQIASYFAGKSAPAARGFYLAESAAQEGYYQLLLDPTFRSGSERVWNQERYRYTIIDPTADLTDTTIEILGEGWVGDQMRSVRLRLTRPDPNSRFHISLWTEEQ